VNLQISQHEANRVLRLENQLNSNSILHAQFSTENLDVDADTDFNTQLDELPGSACYCNMDTTSTALDIRAFETTGDHTKELDDDRSMVTVMYDDVFEIVGTKRKLTQNPENGGSRCSSPGSSTSSSISTSISCSRKPQIKFLPSFQKIKTNNANISKHGVHEGKTLHILFSFFFLSFCF